MANLTLDQAFAALAAQPPGSQVTPIRMVAHGESGVVLYAHGGLSYQPKPVPGLYTTTQVAFTLAEDEKPFIFDNETLVTIAPDTNASVRVLDNLAFDVSVHDNSVPEPFFQTFLVTRAEQFTVKLGSATRLAIDRQTLLRISYGTIYSGFVVADIPLVQDGVFLRGIGPLIRDPNLTAMWTVSLLEPVPFAAGVN